MVLSALGVLGKTGVQKIYVMNAVDVYGKVDATIQNTVDVSGYLDVNIDAINGHSRFYDNVFNRGKYFRIPVYTGGELTHFMRYYPKEYPPLVWKKLRLQCSSNLKGYWHLGSFLFVRYFFYKNTCDFILGFL